MRARSRNRNDHNSGDIIRPAAQRVFLNWLFCHCGGGPLASRLEGESQTSTFFLPRGAPLLSGGSGYQHLLPFFLNHNCGARRLARSILRQYLKPFRCFAASRSAYLTISEVKSFQAAGSLTPTIIKSVSGPASIATPSIGLPFLVSADVVPSPVRLRPGDVFGRRRAEIRQSISRKRDRREFHVRLDLDHLLNERSATWKDACDDFRDLEAARSTTESVRHSYTRTRQAGRVHREQMGCVCRRGTDQQSVATRTVRTETEPATWASTPGPWAAL